MAAVVDFGHDLAGIEDLDPMMAEVDGPRLLAEALARRLITPRGSLIDDPNYGFDLRQYLNDDLSPREIARIAASIDAEFAKDERVQRSSTTLTVNAGVLTLVSSITTAAGPFRLVLAISDVTVSILKAAA